VIVNEFGEIGLDHLLVEAIDGEMVLLKSGCICCSVRSDLESSLRELLARRDAGRIDFARIVIETTGLADPAPIAHLTLNHPLTAPFLAPARIVATVDAPNGARHLREHWEARKQVALADAVLLTQLDLASEETSGLGRTVARLNPAAAQFACVRGDVEPEVLLAPGSMASCADAGIPGHATHHAHGEIASLALAGRGAARLAAPAVVAGPLACRARRAPASGQGRARPAGRDATGGDPRHSSRVPSSGSAGRLACRGATVAAGADRS